MNSRFTILILSSSILFTFYYAYDIPAALNTRLSTDKSILGATHLTILYSAYAFPNIILPLFTISIFPDPLKLCLLVLLGNVVFLSGVLLKKFSLMVLGRIVFGVGSEGFSVLQSKMMAKHFMGRELALSMGLSSAFARCGTVLNYILTPIIAERHGAQWSCIVSVLLIVFSIFTCTFLEKMTSERTVAVEAEPEDITAKKPFLETTKEIMEDGWANFAGEPNEQRGIAHDFYEIAKEEEQKEVGINFETKEEPLVEEKKVNDTAENPSTSPLQTSSQVFSILVALSFMYAVIFAPFQSISSLILQKRYNMSNTRAGFSMAVEEMISLFLSILIAFFADFIGYKLIIVIIGSLCLTFSFGLLLSYSNVALFIICLGIAGSFISCHWPCITYLCSSEDIGRAFAICTCVLNFAYVFGPMIVSFLALYDSSYDMVCCFLMGVSVLSCVFVIVLSILNRQMKLGLNDSSIYYK